MARDKTISSSRLPRSEVEVARRLRAVRLEEDFSVAELARETGITYASLNGYEHGRAPLTFAAGMKICRRLDINERWLATGEEPRRPYVSLEALGVPTLGERNKEPFTSVFQKFLQTKLVRWHKVHPPAKLVGDIFLGGPPAALRRMSRARLEAHVGEWATTLRSATNDHMKSAIVANIELALLELKQRIKA